MRLSNVLESPPTEEPRNGHLSEGEANGLSAGNGIAADLRTEALEQIARDVEVREEVDKEIPQAPVVMDPEMLAPTLPQSARRRYNIRRLIELGKSQKTTKLLLQIWQSDYSIIGFVLTMGSFYLMKDTRYGPVGVLFFLLAMAEIDAILSIFVVRLSFHQNKHGFYRTEDFERDWLRYRMLLSMTKVALLFIVATSCGTGAVIGCYIMWFCTATLRLRYIILRWSMDDHYPDLQRWSIFALLREAGIEPKLKNFNVVALLGMLLGFGISFLFEQ